MPYMLIKGERYPVGLVVFDKDGLMFKSQQFWKELGESRLRLLYERLPGRVCKRWANVFGVREQNGAVEYVDPKGAFAVASPAEEMAVTAGLIIDALGWTWTDARALAVDVYAKADEEFDLSKALMPQDGLLQIFEKLNDSGIPYAVATSDTRDRVNRSMRLFGIEPPTEDYIIAPENVKRGKPFPDMLLLAAQRSSVPINSIVMIGDSYVDVQMAHEAGAIGIGIPETPEMRDKMVPFAAKIIHSLNEIDFIK